MILYTDFAQGLSFVDVAMYLVLVAIVYRRAHFRDRRIRYNLHHQIVAFHARLFEGPLVTILLILALGTGVASLLIGSPDYAKFAGYFIAAIRGGLFFVAIWLLTYYWGCRETWT